MPEESYLLLPSPFGPLSIVWRQAGEGAIVLRVFVSSERASAGDRVRAAFRQAQRQSHPAMVHLGDRLQAFLEGADVCFDLAVANLAACSAFQQRVLVAEHNIPRGSVSTYGRIAAYLGCPGAARAVGAALAGNPFPLIIPCHRAIRSDGGLGGYQGGIQMKARLLAMEGVTLGSAGKVVAQHWYYDS